MGRIPNCYASSALEAFGWLRELGRKFATRWRVPEHQANFDRSSGRPHCHSLLMLWIVKELS
jgi:hypothetical protein